MPTLPASPRPAPTLRVILGPIRTGKSTLVSSLFRLGLPASPRAGILVIQILLQTFNCKDCDDVCFLRWCSNAISPSGLPLRLIGFRCEMSFGQGAAKKSDIQGPEVPSYRDTLKEESYRSVKCQEDASAVPNAQPLGEEPSHSSWQCFPDARLLWTVFIHEFVLLVTPISRLHLR